MSRQNMSSPEADLVKTQTLLVDAMQHLAQKHLDAQHVYIYSRSLASVATRELEDICETWRVEKGTPCHLRICGIHTVIHQVADIMYNARGFLHPQDFDLEDVIVDMQVNHAIMALDLKLHHVEFTVGFL